MSNKSIFAKFKSGLKKTSGQIASIFKRNHIDDEFFEELYEKLILADVGASLADELLTSIKKDKNALATPEALLTALKKKTAAMFPQTPEKQKTSPFITLVIGVNGAGKTTTIAKLASRIKADKKTVLLCAADTFRAAAIEQLKDWAAKIDVPIIAPPEGSDPASAAYDAVIKGLNSKTDEVIIDTAGRLHTKHNLMEEMKKIHRVLGKALPGAPHEVLLVLDGTAGQNALSQAKAFHAAVPLTGIVITKLDGTAKGGIVLRVASELALPVLYAGFGEKADDLVEFDREAYADALFEG